VLIYCTYNIYALHWCATFSVSLAFFFSLSTCNLSSCRSTLVFSCYLWQNFSFFFFSFASWNKNIKLLHFSMMFNLGIKNNFWAISFLESVSVPDFPAFSTNGYPSILLIFLSFLRVCSRPFGMSYLNL
jgi:hypothetical protein